MVVFTYVAGPTGPANCSMPIFCHEPKRVSTLIFAICPRQFGVVIRLGSWSLVIGQIEPRMNAEHTKGINRRGARGHRAAKPQTGRSAPVLGRSRSRDSERVAFIGSRPNLLAVLRPRTGALRGCRKILVACEQIRRLQCRDPDRRQKYFEQERTENTERRARRRLATRPADRQRSWHRY